MIDTFNIRGATLRAMRLAVSTMPRDNWSVVVDGRDKIMTSYPCEAIVGGDGKIAEIGAASIIAKYIRDQIMIRLARKYPYYGFEKHKGYGTKAHIEAIKKHGISPFHRLSFQPIKSMQEELCE